MQEKNLIRISLGLALAGLFFLYISSAGAKPQQVQLDEVESQLGRRVEVFGTIYSMHFAKGNAFLELTDGDSFLEIPLFKSVLRGIEEFEVGDQMKVRGKAGTYRDELQVVPGSPADVKIYHVHPIPFSWIWKKIGQVVKVQGKVKEIKRIGTYTMLTLENRGQVRVFVPFQLESLPRRGQVVRACGLVQLYKGEPELKLTCEAGLRLYV